MSVSGQSTRRVAVNQLKHHPRYVVWELTLACDQTCAHCGSRAGDARDFELSTEEALQVVEQLHEMGTRDVVLIGGEAYLHEGFLEILQALKQCGIRPGLTTGGKGITPSLAGQMREAGISHISVSVDGLEISHDLIRANKGSYQAALAALDTIHAAGISCAANTNINRVNHHDIETLYAVLLDKQVKSWQVQITTPLGRAADRPDMILQPYDLIELMPTLASIKQDAFQRGMLIMPGNNLGYFGPEETLLRSMAKDGVDHWQGCQAGRFIMGIESDGAVKGCPSLQTDSYVGGRLTEKSIAEIWQYSEPLTRLKNRTLDDLWGYCRQCMFAEHCMGGCSFTAHAIFGRPGNNPYCHFRARSLAKQGQRERLVPKAGAQGLPFDNGLFDVVVEEFDPAELQANAFGPLASEAVITSDDSLNNHIREQQRKDKARLMKKHYFTVSAG